MENIQPPYTMDNGCPIVSPQASLRIGNTLAGPQLIQDINLLETISHIVHERIPERVVHAKGAGAYGIFEVTGDVTSLTKAKFLIPNTTTKLFARFSTVVGERGSADSVRDNRGFAFKLYTEEGNLDWLFFSTPTFAIRDGGKFPSFVHCQKRDPRTGLRSASTFWDFMSSNPETFNTLMYVYSDFGTPQSYRASNIYSTNTYKFVTDTDYHYVKIELRSNLESKPLTQQEAEKRAGEDPDYYKRDLYDSIESGNFPTWDVYVQYRTAQDVESDAEALDPTLRWPGDDPPPMKFGRITLNKNVKDDFADVEQASFSPAAIVPGWDVSADPILQTRLFAYGSAARYRLGINFHQLEVNRPKPPAHTYNPTKRDGRGYVDNLPHIVRNYIANDGASNVTLTAADSVTGTIQGYESQTVDANYQQSKRLWTIFSQDKEFADRFVLNVATNLSTANEFVRKKTYVVFNAIDTGLGQTIMTATEDLVTRSTNPETTVPPNTGGVGGS